MKILIIDSHKGGPKLTNNLHLLNANLIAKEINADLIWSYKTVNDDIKSGYDVIIFNHASQYSYVDYAWLQASPNAKLFYITNEYNLGEPRALWMGIKEGRRYDVIANHSNEPSKVVRKYVDNWHITNLNTLVFAPQELSLEQKSGLIYYGSFRKDRTKYFQKYLQGDITVSTHKKNIEKFNSVSVNANFIDRVKWCKEGLAQYTTSLYIEDEKTHEHYNHLANRFYEALNYNVLPIFSKECLNTIVKSGYPIHPSTIFNSVEEMHKIKDHLESAGIFRYRLLEDYKKNAAIEKKKTIETIKNIIYGNV
jgi:hypothetical protein